MLLRLVNRSAPASPYAEMMTNPHKDAERPGGCTGAEEASVALYLIEMARYFIAPLLLFLALNGVAAHEEHDASHSCPQTDECLLRLAATEQVRAVQT